MKSAFFLKQVVVIFFTIFIFTNSIAQTSNNSCGFDFYHQKLLNRNPEYALKVKQFDLNSQNFVLPKSNSDYKIPIVVHILHTGQAVGSGMNKSETDIRKAIEALNNYWRKTLGTSGDGNGEDMKIEFVLASRDPSGNCTNGIVREDLSAKPNYIDCGVNYAQSSCGVSDSYIKTNVWNPSQYYNIYIVNKIDNLDCQGGGVAGYAYLSQMHGSTMDGTVLLSCSFFNNSSTLTHELGHAFNLYHTFEGDNNGTNCPSTPNGCGSGLGDCCADIPSHIRTLAQANLYYDCMNTDINSCDLSTNVQDHILNYMDYSGCANEFSLDQKTRVTNALLNERSSFLAINGNLSLTTVIDNAPVLDFFTENRFVCTSTLLKFWDISNCLPNSTHNTPFSNISFRWQIEGPSNFTSTNQNPEFTINTPGIYDVTFSAILNQDTFQIKKLDYLTVQNLSNNYCVPSSSNLGAFAHTVFNFKLNEINNTTSSLYNSVNTDFSCNKSTGLISGASYDISASISSGGTGVTHVSAYIDYNNNGSFEASEKIMNGATANINDEATITSTINIPNNAVQNTKLLMRVVSEANNAPTLNKVNCIDDFYVGDVEDYGVYIGKAITQTATISGETSACENTTTSYSCSTVANATAYFWEVPYGSSIVSGQGTSTIEVLFGDSTGSISVTPLNNVDHGNSTNFAVQVFSLLTCPNNIIGEKNNCFNDTISYVYANANPSFTYVWTVPNACNIIYGQSTDSIVVVYGNNSGNVKVVASGPNNTVYTITKPVFVLSSANPNFSINSIQDLTALCANDEVEFTSTTSNSGPNPSYKWKLNNVVISTNPNFSTNVLKHFDEIFCTLINDNKCSIIDSVESDILTANVATFDTGLYYDNSLIYSLDATAETYQWINCANNSNISGEISNTFKPNINGSYAVKLEKQGCQSKSECIEILTLGINKIQQISFSISPNPSHGNFTIISDFNAKNAEINVYNVLGEIMATKRLSNEFENSLQLDLPLGMYFLQLRDDQNNSLVQKIIIE